MFANRLLVRLGGLTARGPNGLEPGSMFITSLVLTCACVVECLKHVYWQQSRLELCTQAPSAGLLPAVIGCSPGVAGSFPLLRVGLLL